VTTLSAPQKRDYIYYVYDNWGTRRAWASLAPPNAPLEPLARIYFWDLHRENILNELREWQKHGYEIEGNVGAESIKVCLTKRVVAKPDFIDVLSWIGTFGIVLFMRLLVPEQRIYAIYRPIEFRLKMYCPPADVKEDMFAEMGKQALLV